MMGGWWIPIGVVAVVAVDEEGEVEVDAAVDVETERRDTPKLNCNGHLSSTGDLIKS